MTRHGTRGLALAASAVSLFTASTCGTLEFRDIQSEFNDAVGADNAMTANPLAVPTTPRYEELLERLTPEAIGKLDARLQPNAWMIRGLAAWRVGNLDMARQAAASGRDHPSLTAGSRDEIVLIALDGLIIDAELGELESAAASCDTGTYDGSYKGPFEQSWTKLGDAERAFGPATPAAIRSWLYYQRWRIATNWEGVIARCGDATNAERRAMRCEAGVFIGIKQPAEQCDTARHSPQDAAEAARDQVRGPLRGLIRAQGGGQ